MQNCTEHCHKKVGDKSLKLEAAAAFKQNITMGGGLNYRGQPATFTSGGGWSSYKVHFPSCQRCLRWSDEGLLLAFSQ